MKKSTLNAIMTGVIIFLVIAIIALVIKIQLRPKTVEVAEEPVSQEVSEVVSEEVQKPSEEAVTPQDVVNRIRIIKDNINVRSGPGTENERLGAAYFGYDFELVEQRSDGWTQIVYDGKEAYVYSEYVEIVPMVLNEQGTYTEYVNLDNEIPSEASQPQSEEPSTEPTTETTE